MNYEYLSFLSRLLSSEMLNSSICYFPKLLLHYSKLLLRIQSVRSLSSSVNKKWRFKEEKKTDKIASSAEEFDVC